MLEMSLLLSFLPNHVFSVIVLNGGLQSSIAMDRTEIQIFL